MSCAWACRGNTGIGHAWVYMGNAWRMHGHGWVVCMGKAWGGYGQYDMVRVRCLGVPDSDSAAGWASHGVFFVVAWAYLSKAWAMPGPGFIHAWACMGMPG